MSEQNAPRAYGVRVGLVSGLFAIGQVLLSVAAARGAEAPLRAIQQTFDILSGGGLADPTLLAPSLLPMLLSTYLSILVGGLLTLWFAARAGRLAAIAQGRRAGGAAAGMWVWLVSTGIWLLASIIATVITNSDGTVSGVFFGTFSSAQLPQELIFLLLQEIVAALVCLGFCALTGAQGARNAPVARDQTPLAPWPGLPGYPQPGAYGYGPYSYAPYHAPGYPVYPPQPGQPYGSYPAYPGYPPAGWGVAPNATPPSDQPTQSPPTPPTPAPMAAPTSSPMSAPILYPPPPSHYVPQPPSASQAPQPEQG
jgi:hypothetical protein